MQDWLRKALAKAEADGELNVNKLNIMRRERMLAKLDAECARARLRLRRMIKEGKLK